MKIQAFATFLLLTICALNPNSSSGQPRDISEGVHYFSVDTLQEDPGGEDFIVVNELFWYGCPRCSSLRPLTNYWRDGIRGDLRFSRIPVIWNDLMQQHARIFFTAEKLNMGDRFHEAVYSKMHNEGDSILTEKDVATLFSRHGVEPTDFQSAWKSADVDDSVRSATILSNDLELDKIPGLLIDGRYVVTQNHAVPDHHEMIITTNLLIKKLRDMRRLDGG